MSKSEQEPRELISRIAEEKRARLDGGGPDFWGSLKRLVAIWTDPSHALVELLQNADDAGADTVEYIFLEEGVIFRHNGHPFKGDEIWGICSIDGSTKDAETHTGFMGIGFKAVYRLSDQPHVFSEPYRFYFCQDGTEADDWGWILVPKWIENHPPHIELSRSDETSFWLPYKTELSKPRRQDVEQAIFERFDSLSLMFLRNARKITAVKGDLRERRLRRNGGMVLEETERGETHHRFVLFGSRDDELFTVPEKVKEEYRVVESGRDKAEVRRVELAFELDDDGNLRPSRNAKLYVFLPSSYSTGLRFTVQGDFILDTARNALDETLEWNRWLWNCAFEVLKTAVEHFKGDDKHRFRFYWALPVSTSHFPSIVREELVEPFWEWCRQSPIILASSGEWIRPDQAVIADKELQKLLDAKKLEDLVGRRYFVHPEVQGPKAFFSEIGVIELKESEVLTALGDQQWVEGHPNKWFKRLYRFLWNGIHGDDDVHWEDWWRYYNDDDVKKLALVKTTQGVLKPACDVLISSKDFSDTDLVRGIPDIFIVDDNTVDDTGMQLLREWGAGGFEAQGVVRIVLKGFEDDNWRDWSPTEYERCLGLLNGWLRDREWQAPARFQTSLGAVRIQNRNGELRRADECYFVDPRLLRLIPAGSFIDEDDDQESAFLRVLGVTDRPRINEYLGDHEQWKGPDWAKGWRRYIRWFRHNTSLSGNQVVRLNGVSVLDIDIAQRMDPGPATDLLEYLVRNWDEYYRDFTSARYQWRYSQSNSYWRSQKSISRPQPVVVNLHKKPLWAILWIDQRPEGGQSGSRQV